MIGVLGWMLVVIAIAVVFSAFRRPEGAAAAAPQSGPDRTRVITGLIVFVLGGGLAAWPSLALARLTTVELTRQDSWCTNPPISVDGPLRWEGKALVANLEAGSGRYAVFPVDWEANRFEAEWDVTITHLDRKRDPIQLEVGGVRKSVPRSDLDYASCAVGLMDQNAANIDDRDHVSGSAIEACFSDDVRLRASDANFLVQTSSSTESGTKDLDLEFKPSPPVQIRVGVKYHCFLTYDGRTHSAALVVKDNTGQTVASRRLEDLKDFTSSVAWFGVTVRGYNRYDKKLDPKKSDTGYVRPRAEVRLENVTYRQP